MPFKIYKGGSNISEGEGEILSSLAETLANQYSNSSEFCYLFVGLDCGRQIDALLIKSSAIINIEIKDYSGERVISTAQGDLIVEPQQVRLSKDRKNPFEQVRQQNYAVKNFIFDNQSELFRGKAIATTNDIDVCGCIVLRKIKRVDLSSLSSKKAYFKVTDVDKFQKEISTYRGRDFVKKELPLNLDENFAKKLAKLLDLKLVSIENLTKNIVDDEFEILLRQYFRHIAETYKPSKEYIDRQSLEGALLNDQNHILTGAPGAGKSWLLRRMVAAHAEAALRKNSFEKIPCLLEMLRDGHGDYIEKIALALMDVPDPDKIKGKLKSGRFWIVFDGVDEMKDFRANLPRVIDFIKLYPNNRYSLSVRREKYDDSEFRLEFDKLLKDKNGHFEEIRVEQFSQDEWNRYIECELPQIKTDHKNTVDKYLSRIPNRYPLTLKMAVVIIKDSINSSKSLIYENAGKFYESYFNLRLKEERYKTGLNQGSEVILELMLIELGKISTEQHKHSFLVRDVLKLFRDVSGDESTKYYDLFLRAEILMHGSAIGLGAEEYNKNNLLFYHDSYLDYFKAKYLLQEIEKEDVLDKILRENYEHWSLVYLCGILTDVKVVSRIIIKILELNKIDLAIDCYCHTSLPLMNVKNNLSDKIIEEIGRNKYFKKYLLRYLKNYGELIYTKELQEFIIHETEKNILFKIDWEFLKISNIIFGNPDKKYQKTFRYALKEESRNNQLRQLQSLFDDLADCPEAQDEKGHGLFYKLLRSLIKHKGSNDNPDSYSFVNPVDLLQFITDDSYHPNIRTIILREIRWDIPETEFKQLLQSLLMRLSDLTEPYLWIMVSLCLYTEAKGDTIVTKLFENFWLIPFPNVQVRIVFMLCGVNNVSLRLEFARKIVEKYECQDLIDLNILDHLIDSDMTSWEDGVSLDEQASTYFFYFKLTDFQDETYETLIKCMALDYLNPNEEESKKLLLKYSFSENDKLRNVAEWKLK